jgi:hypothetical protein
VRKSTYQYTVTLELEAARKDYGKGVCVGRMGVYLYR